MKKPEEKFFSVSQPHHERSNNAMLILEEATKNGWMLSQHWSCPFWDTKDAWQNRLLLKIWPCSIFIIYHHYGFIICTISFDKRRRSQFLFSIFFTLEFYTNPDLLTSTVYDLRGQKFNLNVTLIWTFAIKKLKKLRKDCKKSHFDINCVLKLLAFIQERLTSTTSEAKIVKTLIWIFAPKTKFYRTKYWLQNSSKIAKNRILI